VLRVVVAGGLEVAVGGAVASAVEGAAAQAAAPDLGAAVVADEAHGAAAVLVGAAEPLWSVVGADSSW